MVVLDKLDVDTGIGKELPLVVAFEKKSALVPKYAGLEDEDIGNRGGNDFHSKTRSESTLIRYSPYPLLANGRASASS